MTHKYSVTCASYASAEPAADRHTPLATLLWTLIGLRHVDVKIESTPVQLLPITPEGLHRDPIVCLLFDSTVCKGPNSDMHAAVCDHLDKRAYRQYVSLDHTKVI